MRTKRPELAKRRGKKVRRQELKLCAAANMYGPLADNGHGASMSDQETEVVLVDSGTDDDNSVVVVSEEDIEQEGSEENEIGNGRRAEAPGAPESAAQDLPLNRSSKPEPSNPRKRHLSETQNEVIGNNDFIGFEFSSLSEDGTHGENAFEEANYDDGYLSDANSGSTHTRTSTLTLFPWIKGEDHSRQKEIADWLTLEIKDFVNYISPSEEEITIRNNVINKIKQNISSFWPTTQAHVFGSCATDLYLPGSDIDMVVISTTGDYEQRNRLYQLSSFLRARKLAKNIQVIPSAKVPIVKFVDPEHNIHVDISFERSNGLDAARRIRKWLALTPGLRELVLIIKQFLRSRRLNDVHIGGLGGYATIILVYHFVKLHPRISTGNIAAMENLGTLLIEFFELYGMNFSYDKLVLAINNDESPKCLLKTKCPQFRATKGLFSIVIQDPLDPQNNVTRSSYNLRGLKKAFMGAYQLLISKCYELHGASYKARIGALILGDIIKFRGKDRDFNDDRDKVVNHALILDDEYSSESYGADGNNKCYFSDMTEDSDVDTGTLDTNSLAHPPKKKAKLKPTPLSSKLINSKLASLATVPADPAKPISQASLANSRADGKKVEDFMSLETDSDGDKAQNEGRKSSTSLDKDTKREYWKLKGLKAVP